MEKLNLRIAPDVLGNVGRRGNIPGGGDVRWVCKVPYRDADHKFYYLMEHPENSERRMVRSEELHNFW